MSSSQLAIQRVAQRVAEGGHHIPAETIIRGYNAGLKNFVTLYKDVIDFGIFFDNCGRIPDWMLKEELI